MRDWRGSLSARSCCRARLPRAGNGGAGAGTPQRSPGSAGTSTATRLEPPAEGEPEEPDEGAVPVPATQESGAVAEIARMRQALEASRAVAILDPTPDNVAAYLYLQQESLQRAATFSDVFRRVVWSTPELDYTLTRPAGALSKQLWSDERRYAQENALATLGERYGLIYLGDAGCAGCRVFGPLLRAFALRHGLDVLAVSLTGEDLEGWPEAVPDNGRDGRTRPPGRPGPGRRAVRHRDRAGSAGVVRRRRRGPARRTDLRAHGARGGT